MPRDLIVGRAFCVFFPAPQGGSGVWLPIPDFRVCADLVRFSGSSQAAYPDRRTGKGARPPDASRGQLASGDLCKARLPLPSGSRR